MYHYNETPYKFFRDRDREIGTNEGRIDIHLKVDKTQTNNETGNNPIPMQEEGVQNVVLKNNLAVEKGCDQNF